KGSGEGGTADIRRIQENAPEAVAFCHLLHQRPGIGDCDEVLACAITLYLPHPVVEILIEHQRLGRSARLACHYKQRVREIDILFEALNRGGTGAVQYMASRGTPPFSGFTPAKVPRHNCDSPSPPPLVGKH